MPTDYQKLSDNLCRFYDFTGKTVLFIGAGGRQLLDPAAPVRKLIAVDKDPVALRELRANLVARHLEDSVEVIDADFDQVTILADTIYFEFCLHEMPDPRLALVHAKSLAPDVVVFDHAPGSIWSFHAAEEDKVARSCAAMERFGLRKRRRFHTHQWFNTHDELIAKVSSQGPLAFERARRFLDCSRILIPMDYELNLL